MTGAIPLTDRQRAILEFIVETMCRTGYWPSLRETARRFGYAGTNGVMLHIKALAKKGYIDPGDPDSKRQQKARLLLLPDGTPVKGFAPVVE